MQHDVPGPSCPRSLALVSLPPVSVAALCLSFPSSLSVQSQRSQQAPLVRRAGDPCPATLGREDGGARLGGSVLASWVGTAGGWGQVEVPWGGEGQCCAIPHCAILLGLCSRGWGRGDTCCRFPAELPSNCWVEAKREQSRSLQDPRPSIPPQTPRICLPRHCGGYWVTFGVTLCVIAATPARGCRE